MNYLDQLRPWTARATVAGLIGLAGLVGTGCDTAPTDACPCPPVSNVRIVPDTVSVQTGSRDTVRVETQLSEDEIDSVDWTISDSLVAEVGVIDQMQAAVTGRSSGQTHLDVELVAGTEQKEARALVVVNDST